MLSKNIDLNYLTNRNAAANIKLLVAFFVFQEIIKLLSCE